MQTKRGHQKNINDILNEPIAIIGMNCQFPGINSDVEDVDAFYEMLLKEQTSIKEVPENRWDINQYYDADRQKENKIVSRKGGFLNDPQLFDAAFFKITPTEAKQMDPQQRLFLEVSIRALNHANIPLDSLKNSNTGVYCGVSTHDYSQLNYKDHITFNAYTYIGSADSAAPGRLCHFLNLKGPCMTVDTACSSSLSALYLAAMALRNQQCDMAIVGGVHLSLCPEIFIGVTKANMLSALGQCSSFDAAADGYARSEGCAVVVVKRLSDALKDQNKILAVMKSIVMNQDGGGGMGMAAPNIEAQIAMHQSALAQAQVAAGDIDYIETHGTGTILGDEVEFNAIQHIHQGHHSKDSPLIIGAVKSNLGHTISASGIASLIKVIASLNNERIPANLHYTTPSPSIAPESIPALLPVQATPFVKRPNKKRYAQVSNFGFTGTNVSAVIEEPPESALIPPRASHDEPECFVLSAHSEYSLKHMLARYLRYLKESSASLHDVCSTLINCRDHYKFRCAIIAQNKDELIQKIEEKAYELNKVVLKKDIKIIEHDAQKIYAHYISGANIRFDKNKESYNQVDLPLYFFDRKTYWHDKEDQGTVDAPVPQDWGFKLQWQNQPVGKDHRKLLGKPWLLIGAKHLAPDFVEQGLPIVLDDNNPALDTLEGIIFAANFDSMPPKDIEAHIDLQKNTLKKLLGLLKELQHKAIELQLVVLTTNAIAELADDTLNLDSSALLGFCKTLVLELPQYQTTLIDLDKHDEGYYPTQVVNEIYYNHGQNYEHVVAYRNGQRLVSRLKSTIIHGKKQSLWGEGRYLITGGCGGLGLVTAQALLSVGAKELILVSRHVDKAELKARIKTLQSHYPNQIIRTVGLDITNKEKLRSLLSESNEGGLLKGIIHAAGASINAPLLEHQDEDIDSLFSAKIKGGWYLHELSQHCDLDFFVVYSSVSSVFGSNKESVYSATNSFLDALISERRRLGLVGTAIQWGPWAETGMAEKRARDQGLKQAFIHNDQGRALIHRLINSPLTHVTIISPEYLKFMLDFVPKPRPLFYQYLINDLTGVEHKDNENISPWLNDYVQMDNNQKSIACKSMVSTVCKEILELADTEELEVHEGFFELGFDSLMVTELATRLKEKLKPFLNVTATVGFDYPSISKLAQYIEAQLQDSLMTTQALQPSTEPADDAIAIISMSCSLPNAPDVTAFESLLEQGLSGVKEIPLERWDNKKYYDPNPDAPGKSYITKLGLIDNIKSFDAQFFGISPREAPLMDPQQRLFLEHCYQALENANYPVHSLRGSLTGVFAGVGASHEYYSQLEQAGLSHEEKGMFAVTGKALNMIPGRVTYTFDFKGPAVSFDTACSSSLVAIHYACQSLKTREIDLALAGGVNVLLRPESIVNLCKAKALSLTSQCKTFDEEADGYVRAEGCGVLLLKRLTDALRDNDTILAVIKASAVSNDGKTAGLTVPNGKSQEEVMRKALHQTSLTSSDISYIETHGTGTPLGDPIEVHAINQVYGVQRSPDNPLYLGAVKTNLGHLESAAGVASMIKVILGLQKGRIYKNINFQRLNPKIKLGNTRLALDTMDWTTQAPLKCAAINAFGFSGTNAHVIVQEFPDKTRHKNTPAAQTGLLSNVLLLSAKSQNALDNLAKRYQQYLATTPDAFSDICFTAATCREHYSYRLAVAAQSAVEASQMVQKGGFVSSPEDTKSLDAPPELAALVSEYLQGRDVDWRYYYAAFPGAFNKVSLPNYTFDRHEFWLEKRTMTPAAAPLMHPLLGRRVSMPGNEYLFHHQLDVAQFNYLHQYRVFDTVLVPAAVYLELGFAAAQSILKCPAFSLEHGTMERPLSPEPIQEVQLRATPKDNERYTLALFAKQHEQWEKYSEMELHSITSIPDPVDIQALKSSFGTPVDIAQFYAELKKGPVAYAPELQVLQEGYGAVDRILTKVALLQHESGYYYHPLILEGMMQSILLLYRDEEASAAYMPYAFTRITTFQEAGRVVWVQVAPRDTEQEQERCVDVALYDNTGSPLGFVEQLRLKKVNQSHFISYEFALHHLYDTTWNLLHANVPSTAEFPELWVIARDEVRAQKILGSLKYQLVNDITQLGDVATKNIVFLYDEQHFTEFFHWCQRMFQHQPARFIFVTENAYALNDKYTTDRVNPYHTMASSFWKSFRNELGFTQNYTIDLDSRSTLSEVLRYVVSTTSAETQFAVRDAIYVPRLKKKQLPLPPEHHEVLLDREASYLITGDTGGLAHPLMEYLMRRGAKHLVITSRSACSNETQVLIERARKKQVEIKHYSCDAANAQGMEHLITEIEHSAHPLRGIFHLAGVIRDELIVNLSDNEVHEVLRAKMDSALILHQLTKNLHLDVFVLFSSSASILGSRGQANYVAANGFLDGLAHLRQQQGLPALAINWGAFHSIGMAAKNIEALEHRGFIPLNPESIDVLDVLVPSKVPQIAVCPVHWDLYFKTTPKPSELSGLVEKASSTDKFFLAMVQRHAYKERIPLVRQALCDIAADVLGLESGEEVGIKNDLFAMGMDSLMALEFRNRIHDKLNCPTLSLPIEYFINEPRIDKIAKNIANEIDKVFASARELLPAEKSTDEEIALCDTQYVFWIFNKLGSSFNCGMQIQLRGNLNKKYLYQAFDFTIQQNPVFWLSFNKEVPIQTVKKEGQFKLIYEDISLNYDQNTLNDVFYENIMQLIPLTAPPLIRVYLYKLNHDLHELHIMIPHIILDDPSYRILFDQFRKNYAILLRGKNLVPASEEYTYFDFVKQNNDYYEKDLHDKMDFWRVYNKNFQRLSFGRAHHLPDAANQPQNLFHYPVDAQLVEQFRSWHQERNINVSTGLIAACQIVFYKLSKQKKIPITILHSGREGSRYSSVIGLFTEYKMINITLNEEYKFIDFLKSIEEQFLITAPYQKCAYAIKSMGLKGSRLSFGQYLIYIYNRLTLAKHFKKSKLNSIVVDYQLKSLSRVQWRQLEIQAKHYLNNLFKLNLPLQKPARLRIIINITANFFIKGFRDMNFEGLDSSAPNHYGSVDRNIGNEALWLYFTKDQYGEYRLSINGPLTKHCKDQIAYELNQVIAKVLKSDEYTVDDLMRE